MTPADFYFLGVMTGMGVACLVMWLCWRRV